MFLRYFLLTFSNKLVKVPEDSNFSFYFDNLCVFFVYFLGNVINILDKRKEISLITMLAYIPTHFSKVPISSQYWLFPEKIFSRHLFWVIKKLFLEYLWKTVIKNCLIFSTIRNVYSEVPLRDCFQGFSYFRICQSSMKLFWIMVMWYTLLHTLLHQRLGFFEM